MRRNQIIHALTNVGRAIAKCKLNEISEVIANSKNSPTSRLGLEVLDIYADYKATYDSLTSLEKEVIDSFGLNGLEKAEFWAKIFEREEGKRPIDVFQLRFAADILNKAIENFVPLLQRQTDDRVSTIEGFDVAGSRQKIDAGRMTFLVKTELGSDLGVAEFSSILNNIQILYDIISTLSGGDHIPLVIGSIDSGSDKSIDVIGVAEAISKLSTLMLEGWDRIRFRKEQKLEKSFKSMSEGITLIDKISTSIENKSISPEEGEKMKRNVIRCLDGLVLNGVYTPESEEQKNIKPSEIAVERRLLITHRKELQENENAPPSSSAARSSNSLPRPRAKPRATRKTPVD